MLRPALSAPPLRPLAGAAGGAMLLASLAPGIGHVAVLCAAAAAMLALCAGRDGRAAAMLGWYGLALGLWTPAALLAPLIVALVIQRRVPWRLWPVAPAIAVVAMLASGPPAAPTGSIAAGAPNLWAIALALPWIGKLPLTGLAVAATTGMSAAFVAWFAPRPLHGRAWNEAALLCVLTIGACMPWLGPDAFLLGDVLALAFALTVRERRAWRIAWLVQAGSMLALLGDRDGRDGLVAFAAVPMLIAAALLARTVLRPAANDNPLMARAFRPTPVHVAPQLV